MQEAQSNLTQAIQILTNFYTKVIQNDSARLESETTASESEAVHTFEEFTRKVVNSGTGRRECHAEECENKHNSCLPILWAMKQCQTRLRCVISVLKQMRTRLP